MASRLATIPSPKLLADVKALVRRGRAVEAELLARPGEVDARRLYLDEACSSMFVYCVRVLHFAEAVAYKRIAAARAARRHPALLEAVRRGELHVTAVSLLAPELTEDNADELVAAARHRTAEQIRRLLADRKPRPDVAAGMRRAPLGRRTAGVCAATRPTSPQAPVQPRGRTATSSSPASAADREPASACSPERPLGRSRRNRSAASATWSASRPAPSCTPSSRSCAP